ncbi:ABC transporter permease subunit [Gloeocapsopsis crepidinum LEGE 06123]|uniref:ABC transporter permease subunit n=1 Tax=Gloeocapsopsis crepidinum LEGE 06123 TaxID=588587 RepID=A0ABR9UR15_9CHRO|nr:ABC transporter permease subunit [Gloeocapsopsis crepidinum LEGE 06123]
MLFAISFIWSLHIAGISERDLVNQGGWNLVWRFVVAAIHPELSREFLLLTLNASLKTLAYAVCSTFFSILIGLIAGVLSSEVWWSIGNNQTPWLFGRGILAFPRAIHELIWGLFLINIFGLDPLVAILAIAIPFGAITAKVFSEILDETPRQPLLALLNSGASPFSAFVYGLFPQAFPNLLSYSFYRFECSIRSAAVLGIIGAGGLGYQLLLSLQSLRYEQMWTLLGALIILSGSTDFGCTWLRDRWGLPSRLDLNVLNFQQHRKLLQRDSVFISILAAIILFIFSFWYVQADFSKLWQVRSYERLATIIQIALPPNTSQLNQLFTLATRTLAMSILAIASAGFGGIILAFLAARNFVLPQGILSDATKSSQLHLTFLRWGVLLCTRFFLLFIRAVPEPIWALIFLFVLFPGILPGAIALGLHNLGILGRLMAEVVENLDQRPLRSLQAAGATNPQVFLYGVLPSTFPRFFAYILYRWEVCMRATVIVGIVGAGGLGRLLTEQLSSFDYNSLLTTLIVFVILTFIVDLISASVRKTLR